MRAHIGVYLFVVGFLTGISVQALAGGPANPCTEITNNNNPHMYIGNVANNKCWGEDRYDSFYGYGGIDELHGRPDRDHIRGAEGGDDMFDEGTNQSDTDQFCDGDGNDDIDSRDGDGKDTLWATGNDGFGYTYQANFQLGDDVENIPGQSCPLVD